MNKELMFSSKTDMWETPQDLFNNLNEEFHFTLDVCATKENAKCDKYYTIEDDGLSKSWKGICWCNPPYGRQINLWVKKAYNEFINNNSTIVMLLPARTDTKWFHEFILEKSEIRLIKGRLKFGDSKTGAPFPSMIIVYDKNITPKVIRY